MDLVEAYLQEAKWYYSGYTPSMEEYLNNSIISIGAPTVLAQVFLTSKDKLYKYNHIIRLSGMLVRLPDDLGTLAVCVQNYSQHILSSLYTFFVSSFVILSNNFYCL